MAETLEFPASKTHMARKIHAIQLLGTITPRFKREATSWYSRMRKNENGKRKYTDTLLTLLKCFYLFIHPFPFLFHYFYFHSDKFK